MNNRTENQTQLLCRCLTAVLFLAAAALIFFTVATVGNTKISTWDMTHLSQKISSVAGNSTVVGNVVNEYVSSYLLFLLILMILPMVEAASLLIWRSKISAWIGLAGGCVNGIMLITMYAKLRSVTETFTTWLTFFGGDQSGNAVVLKNVVFILWAVLYISIIGLSLFNLYQVYGEHRPKKKMAEISQIPKQQKKVESVKAYTEQIQREKQTVFVESPNGILEGRGQLSGQIYPLMENQSLCIGALADGCDIPIKDFPQGGHCRIEFNQSERVYLLTPNQRRLVYLESGQPLGADRTYTIARGKRIYLKERAQMFECK